MLEQLPVGTYLPSTSFLHSLQARTKLIVLVWLAAVVFLADHRAFHWGVFTASFAVLASGLALAGVSPAYLWRRMRLLLLLLAITMPGTLFVTPGKTLYAIGPFPTSVFGGHSHAEILITYDGVWYAVSLSAIFLILFVGSLLLTITTTPVALAEGIVLLLRPLRRFGLPVDEFGLMTLICLRFFPLVLEEASQLMKAQLSRGADFSTGTIGQRMRAFGTLLVPLVQGALRRAASLSVALDARGFGVGGEATPLHEHGLGARDWVVLLGVPLLTLVAYFFW